MFNSNRTRISLDEYNTNLNLINQQKPRKIRSNRKKKRSSQPNRSFETETTAAANPDGRHYHLDMNTVPFILGASTNPSHNVKSNLQNVSQLKKDTHLFKLNTINNDFSF